MDESSGLSSPTMASIGTAEKAVGIILDFLVKKAGDKMQPHDKLPGAKLIGKPPARQRRHRAAAWAGVMGTGLSMWRSWASSGANVTGTVRARSSVPSAKLSRVPG